MESIYQFLLSDAPRIIEALLAIVGGLKIVARYTPWKWDDKAFETAEKWIKWVWEKMPKPKKDE